MKVDKEIVKHVAELGRIYLEEDEVEDFSEQLGKILGWAEKLKELDVDHLEPTAHVLDEMKNVFKPDEKGESLTNEKALENAPAKEGGYFKVPQIIEE